MKKCLLLAQLFFVGTLGVASTAMPAVADTEVGREVSLERVLDLTLKNSFKIALADEQFQAAARALKAAKRRRLPRVGVQGWFSGDLFEVEEWGSDNLGGYMTLDWDFYQDGAIMQLVAQSWANLASARLTRRQTVLDLIYNSTALFYDALKANRQLEIARLTLERDTMQRGVVRTTFDQGRASRSELVDADARVSESELSLARAEQDMNMAILNLQQLTRDDSVQGVEDLPRGIPWTLDFPVEDAIKTALDRQPGVLIAKANLEMSHLAVKYAKLKRWPSVRFLTGTDYAFAPLAQPDEFGFRVGVILSYPLYDAGDRRSRIEDAKSAERLAQIRLWEAQDQMKKEVTDSYAVVAHQLQLLHIAENRHGEAKREFEIALRRYKEKRLDQLEMTRIRLTYLQSVQRLENLRLDALLARAKLLKSVGVSSMDEIRTYCSKGSEEKK